MINMADMNFISKIAPYIQKYAKQYGYKFPSIIIAQAVLESGNGGSALSVNYHNYFGLKCGSSWRGSVAEFNTKEYVNGEYITVKARFRAYSSMEEGVKGYFDFISSGRYANLKQAVSPRDYVEKIKLDGYATSISYVNNVMNIYYSYHLVDYDVPTPITANTSNGQKSITEIAKEVIRGKWGNGQARRYKLASAGYNYDLVQREVNRLLK